MENHVDVKSIMVPEHSGENLEALSPVEQVAGILGGASLETEALPRDTEALSDVETSEGADGLLDAGAEGTGTVEEPRASRKIKRPNDYWRLVEAEGASWADSLDASDDDNEGCFDAADADEDYGLAWRAQLDCDKKGNIKQTLRNCEIIFENDPALIGLIGFNTFTERLELRKRPPWERPSANPIVVENDGKVGPLWQPEFPDPEWRNSDSSELCAYMSMKYRFDKASVVNTCLDIMARRNSYHPARDFFNSLQWDGVKRLDTLLSDYFGVPDSEYLHAITRKTFVAAVARAFNPGTKFDSVLTLFGPQGCGKSTFFEHLGGRWHTSLLVNIGTKDALQSLQGVILVELAEMASLNDAKVEKIKATITNRDDRYRKPYERLVESHPRQSICVASTNRPDFLKDTTGNRRFWVVDITQEFKPKKDVHSDLIYDAPKIWAEAKAIYDTHSEKLYLDEKMEKVAESIQKSFMSYDPVPDAIEDYLNRLLPENWKSMDKNERRSWLKNPWNVGTVKRTQVCLDEILFEALGELIPSPTKKDRNEIAAFVCTIKYENGERWRRTNSSVRISAEYGKQKAFRRY